MSANIDVSAYRSLFKRMKTKTYLRIHSIISKTALHFGFILVVLGRSVVVIGSVIVHGGGGVLDHCPAQWHTIV